MDNMDKVKQAEWKLSGLCELCGEGGNTYHNVPFQKQMVKAKKHCWKCHITWWGYNGDSDGPNNRQS